MLHVLLCIFQNTLILMCLYIQVVALIQRSKEAESAFLEVYKQLIEAPGESHTCKCINISINQDGSNPHT